MGACGPEKPPPAPSSAQRIVSLVPSVTETLFALGAGDRVVGISTWCDHPPEALARPRVGDLYNFSVEGILALRPDLVAVKGERLHRGLAGRLPVLEVRDDTLAEILASFLQVGEAVGRPDAGRALRERVEADLESVRRRSAGLPRRRVLFVVDAREGFVVGGDNFIDELLSLVGGDNVARDAGGRWVRLSPEVLVARDPEVVLDTSGTGAGSEPTLIDRLGSITAVRAGAVRRVAETVLVRPGPRVGQAAERLRELVQGTGK